MSTTDAEMSLLMLYDAEKELCKSASQRAMGAVVVDDPTSPSQGGHVVLVSFDHCSDKHIPGIPFRLCANGNIDIEGSVWAAYTWMRSSVKGVCELLNCDPATVADRLSRDGPTLFAHILPIHLNKSGSSLGAALAVALTSHITGCPVRPRLGITGCLFLSGKLGRVEGMVDKAKALGKAGVTTLLCPYDNKNDVPAKVRGPMSIEPCPDIWSVLRAALIPKKRKRGQIDGAGNQASPHPP